MKDGLPSSLALRVGYLYVRSPYIAVPDSITLNPPLSVTLAIRRSFQIFNRSILIIYYLFAFSHSIFSGRSLRHIPQETPITPPPQESS